MQTPSGFQPSPPSPALLPGPLARVGSRRQSTARAVKTLARTARRLDGGSGATRMNSSIPVCFALNVRHETKGGRLFPTAPNRGGSWGATRR